MSHFSVLACLPAGTDLAKVEGLLADVMAPWDEGRSVEPHRSYEDGGPEGYWWVESVRRGAEHHRNGTGIKPHDPNFHGLSSERTNRTANEQREGYAEDAQWAERLGEHPTWETVVKLYNERFYPGTELATVDDNGGSDRLHHESETDRAYIMSTYNPESKWDYWRIGGRWGGYFAAKEGAWGTLWGARGWDSPDEPQSLRRVDGGPLATLDFEAMRAEAERKANERYNQWEAICADTPSARAWSHFTGLVDAGQLTIEQAREMYRGQPRIQAARKDDFDSWEQCPVEEFLPPREEYAAEARRGAVPGYALVTLEREWVAPGRMGWFGMSSDGPGERSGYRVAVNTYLDQLDPATLVVVLDCHI